MINKLTVMRKIIHYRLWQNEGGRYILSSNLLQQLFDRDVPVTNFKQTLAEIEQSNIHSQAYIFLTQQGKLEKTPALFQQTLHKKYQLALYQNIFIKNQTEQILQLFEELAIDVIPLKGTRFAETYFKHLGARPTSDIDLLIKETDLEKAVETVKKLGYIIEETRIPFHFHSSLSKLIPSSNIPLTVELHWDLVKENTADFQIEEFWDDATPVNGFAHIKELSNQHLFYMICLHGWRHNLDSLKYFIDIIQLIISFDHKIDYTKLLEDASRHKTKKRIVRTLSIVYEQYPQLEQILPFPYKIPTLYHNRDAKRSLRKYADYIDYSFFSYDSTKHSLIELYHWLHPKY